jgi:hypothetical protein
MPQPLFRRFLTRPLLGLALVATLVLAATQAAEQAHLHGGLDSSEHCLLCKADSQAPGSQTPLAQMPVQSVPAHAAASIRLGNPPARMRPPARAPPVST